MCHYLLVEFAGTLFEANTPALQRIDDTSQITVVVASTIGIGEGVLPIEGFRLGVELLQPKPTDLGLGRCGANTEQQKQEVWFEHGGKTRRNGALG